MKVFFILSCAAIMLAQCSTRHESADLNKVKNDVIKSDIAFSKLSEDSGYQKAFIAYADENMIRLNPRRFATFGRDQLIEDFKKENVGGTDSSILTWKPLHVEMANSGDLASAFGDWQLKTKLPNNKDTVIYGNYITVWKKQNDGGWKFILDGGNPTPGPTDVRLLEKIRTK